VDTIAAAEAVKAGWPSAYVVLGGFTAGSFAHEILETHAAVDGVVRGEGELPMVRLMEAVGGSRPLADVPNLVWRGAAGIQDNGVTWHASDDDLSAFEFARFDLLGRAEDYKHLFPYMFPPQRRHLNRLLFELKRSASFLLPLGRGCMNHCAWCGGGVDATTGLLGRRCISHMSPDAAAAVVEQVLAAGFSSVATDFNGPGVEAVIRGMLGICRKKGLKPRLTMESWTLPSAEFVDEFAASTAPGSAIEFSPDFPLEEQREFYKGYQFTNDDLFATLDRLAARSVLAGVHFLYGLPPRGVDRGQVSKFMDRLHRHPAVERVQHHPCELEPMAPLWLRPERYGIIRKVETFSDFMAMHRSGQLRLGFARPDVSEEELLRRRCDEACIVGKWGKQKCAAMRLVTSRPGLDPLVYAAGRTLWALGQDNAISRKLWPGAK
jgi:hypothetical protein